MATLRKLSLCLVAALLLAALVVHRGRSANSQGVLERAERCFKDGEYDKAKIEYLTLLRLDRKNPAAIRRLGVIWFEEGAPAQAYPYLLKARELAPDDLVVRSKLAAVLSALGERAAARDEARAILQESPGQEEALLVLTDTVQSQEEIEEAKQQLRRIPVGEEVAYHLGEANLALHEGDFAYAEDELKEALKLQPQSARIHLAMANLHSQQGELEQAEKEFQVAAQLSPARSVERLQYAQFEKQIGKVEQAVALLKEITQGAPDDLAAWCMLAEIALSQDKPEESLSLLGNVFARAPQDLEALILQAQAWLARGEAKKAVEQLEQLATNYPNVPLINYHLARAYLSDGDSVAATNAVNAAVAAKSDYADAILLLGEINLSNGNAPLVISAMLSLLRQQPGLAPARLLLEQAYQASGRPDDALASIREEIRASPQSANAYLRLGLVLREQQETVEARSAFEHASELDPDSLQPFEELVNLDLSQRHFDDAMKRVEKLLAKEPDSAEAYVLSGKVYNAQGKWDEAEAALQKALNLEPSLSSAFDLLISTYTSANQLERAISEAQAFLTNNPENKSALTSLALIYEHAKDYPKARDAYEKILSISPNSTEAMNNLAYLCAEHLNEIDKACQMARKARLLKPHDAAIADTLGWSLYKNADYQEAVTLLRESVTKLADNPDVQFHYGMANCMMAETNAAQKAFQRAVSTGREFAGKDEAQQRLAFMERVEKHQVSTSELEAAFQRKPDDVMVCMLLGEAYERAGAFSKAAGAYEQAFKVNAALLPAAVKLAKLNAGPLQNRNMAFAFAKQARDLAPNDAHVAGLLGEILYQFGDFPWAYNLLQESARKLTGDSTVLRAYAWAAYSLGRVSEAQQIMRGMLAAQPDSIQAQDAKWFLETTALDQNRGKLEAAEPDIQTILGADPHYVPALLAKADLQIYRGETKSAEALLNDILERYPDFAPAQKRLAAVYLQDPARIDAAYSLALKATNTLRDDPELARTLGEIAYKKNEYANAIQWFQESARKKPLGATDLYYLGMSQLRMSQDAQSSKSLQDALAAGLSGPMSAEAKAVLTELRRRQNL